MPKVMAPFEKYMPLLDKISMEAANSDSQTTSQSTASSGNQGGSGLSKDDQFTINMLKNDVNLLKQQLKGSKLESIDKMANSLKDLKNEMKIMK